MTTNLTYTPDVVITILSGTDNHGTPTTLKNVMSMECTHTIATSVGKCVITCADASGAYANQFKPNDIISIYIGSPSGPATNPSWTGLVDECADVQDPMLPYGRATQINGSSFWKWMTTTAVPLKYFLSGQYPSNNLSITSLVNTAVGAIQDNTTFVINQSIQTIPNEPETPAWMIPDDLLNPQYQSWASFIGNMVVSTGVELFFNEIGTLVLRPTQYAQPSIDITINGYEIFRNSLIIGDNNLVTVSVVTYTNVPTTYMAAISPVNGLTDTSVSDFVPPDIQSAARLGKRFVSQTIPFITDSGQAQYYAGMIHVLGLANVNYVDMTCCLHGDIKLGTIMALPRWNKQYYVTQVSHRWIFGKIAETSVIGCFGITIGQTWPNSLFSANPLNIPGITSPNTTPYVPDCYTQNSTLPAISSFDPSVLLTNPTLSTYDIQNALSQYGSPLASATVWNGTANVPASTYISQLSSQFGIDPSFTLAVWQAESSLGKTAASYNLGGVGGASNLTAYPSWGAAMLAWYQLLSGPLYISAPGGGNTHVQEIFKVYNNSNWQQESSQVTGYMLNYRNSASLPAPATCGGGNPQIAPNTPWNGQLPSGWPLPSAYGRQSISQGFGPTTLTNEPTIIPPNYVMPPGITHFHYGIDILCPVLTGLFAVCGGTLNAGYNNPFQTYNIDPSGDYGYLITIKNGPYIIKYGHCDSLAAGIVNGQTIQNGAFIGYSDTTGNAGGVPHLHFEIDVNSTATPANPLNYCTPPS